MRQQVAKARVREEKLGLACGAALPEPAISVLFWRQDFGWSSGPFQTHARWERIKSNVSSAAVHVPENTCTTAPIIKMHGAQPSHSDVILVDVVNPIPRNGSGEFHLWRHSGIAPSFINQVLLPHLPELLQLIHPVLRDTSRILPRD